MCHVLKFSDGSPVLLCGLQGDKTFCGVCGRIAYLLCDWKVRGPGRGTCDLPICEKHALQVGPDKHLCPLHQKAYADWQRRHPGVILPPDHQQLSLL